MVYLKSLDTTSPYAILFVFIDFLSISLSWFVVGIDFTKGSTNIKPDSPLIFLMSKMEIILSNSSICRNSSLNFITLVNTEEFNISSVSKMIIRGSLLPNTPLILSSFIFDSMESGKYDSRSEFIFIVVIGNSEAKTKRVVAIIMGHLYFIMKIWFMINYLNTIKIRLLLLQNIHSKSFLNSQKLIFPVHS